MKKIQLRRGTFGNDIKIEISEHSKHQDSLNYLFKRVEKYNTLGNHVLLIAILASMITGVLFPFFGYFFSKIGTILIQPYDSDFDSKVDIITVILCIIAVFWLLAIFTTTWLSTKIG